MQVMRPYLDFWRLLCLGNVVADMDIVSQLNANLDDIQAHLYDVLPGHAVVPCTHVAFESVLQQQNDWWITTALKHVLSLAPQHVETCKRHTQEHIKADIPTELFGNRNVARCAEGYQTPRHHRQVSLCLMDTFTLCNHMVIAAHSACC